MPNLTEAQIIAMAENLTEANGRTPTWQELRTYLGSGSTVTINKYYAPWRKKKDAELAKTNSDSALVIEKVAIPETVLDSLVTAWSTAVAVIKSESQKELEAVQAMLKAENEKLKSEIDECEKVINILESENVEQQDLFSESIKSANNRIDELREELTAKSAELSTLSGRNIELEKQLSISSDALQAERTRTEKALAEVVALTTKLEICENELDRFANQADAKRTVTKAKLTKNTRGVES